MPDGPVHWGSYPGEYLEKVMAVLVAQDHPDVIRRTPSSGDGGVDLMIRDGQGYVVEQVKGFTQRIGSSEQRQIADCWNALIANPRLSRPIIEYRLVVPVDPTSGEQSWFDELTAGQPFVSNWRGQSHWNSLAARHPHVIDYFINGGRDRIVSRQRALTGSVIDPTRPVTPSDVAASLEIMRAQLSKDDPHYRYEFLTSARQPSLSEIGECAIAQTRRMSDGGFLTIKVLPKHRYSLTDQPISMHVEIPAAALTPELRDAFDGFTRFGRALDIPDGALWATIEGPAGLSGVIEGGGARIGPALVDSALQRMRLVLVAETGDQTAEVQLTKTSLTHGPLGGAELKLADPSDSLRVTMRMTPGSIESEAVHSFTINVGEFAGKPVAAVSDVTRLLAHVAPPYELHLLPEYGREVLAEHRPEVDRSIVSRGFATHIDDLALIQPRANFMIVVPTTVDSSFASELHDYARMLRGEHLTGTWDDFTATLREGHNRETIAQAIQSGRTVIVEDTHVVTIDDQEIDLGLFTTVLASARVSDEQDADRGSLRLVPGTDQRCTSRAGGVNSPSQ